MKLLKKTLRFFLYSLVALIIGLNLFVILSGRFYLYKGFVNTYMVGEMGPTIYDLNVFHNDTLFSDQQNGQEWKLSPFYNQQSISKEHREYLEELETSAFIVIHKDSVLYEEYWDQHDTLTVSNSFSMAKSVVSLLIGIAIEDGKIKSLDDSVGDYLPEFKEGKKKNITVKHLLQMASGLDWEESGKNPLSDNAESYFGSDLYAHVTSQKVEREPGKTFIYQSGNTQLLGFVLQAATGKTVSEYASEKIWKKIGMESDGYWSLDREGGNEKAFCCVYSTARDFAKLGKLLLDTGKYEGQQIVPKWYVEEIFKPADLLEEDGRVNRRYGLHFWLYYGMTEPAYFYRGLLGQYIVAIPDQDLLIVRLGSKRIPDFEIPEQFKNDKEYIEKNLDNIGHAPDFFQYVQLGKMIKSQTDFLRNERRVKGS